MSHPMDHAVEDHLRCSGGVAIFSPLQSFWFPQEDSRLAVSESHFTFLSTGDRSISAEFSR